MGAIIAGAIIAGAIVAGAIVVGVNIVGAFVAEQLSRSNCRLHRSNCRRSNYRRSICRTFDILHVNMETVGMNSGGGHFQKGRHFKTTFAYISVSDTHRSMILVSIPMFSRSNNSMRAMITILDLAFQNVG